MILDGGASTVAFLCVHTRDLQGLVAKGYLEKIAFLVRPVLDDALFDSRTHLGGQSLAPTLQQRMQAANSQGRVAMLSQQVDEVKEIMHDNIETMLAEHDRLEALEEKSQEMSMLSKQFKKHATRAKRFHLWNQAKLGVAIGTVVTATAAVVVTPIIVAAAL